MGEQLCPVHPAIPQKEGPSLAVGHDVENLRRHAQATLAFQRIGDLQERIPVSGGGDMGSGCGLQQLSDQRAGSIADHHLLTDPRLDHPWCGKGFGGRQPL